MPTLKDQIRQAQDGQSEIVQVPEWGDIKLEVRSMTGTERAKYLQRAATEDGEMDFTRIYPELLIATCFDPDTGDKVFGPDDADWLNDKNARALERVAKVATRLSGIDEGSVDEAGKGSFPAIAGSTENDASTSTSPTDSA